MKRRRSVTREFIVAAFLVMGITTLISCGGGGGGSSAVPPAFDVTGTWTIGETDTSNSCGELIDSPDTATITQNGSSVVIQFPFQPGKVYNGTMSGDKFTGSGSYPEDGGTTTENVAVTVWSNTYLSGTSTWTWKLGSESCNGTTNFEGSRPLSAPTGLSATATSSTTIELTWTDTSKYETAFEIWRTNTYNGITNVFTVAANVTSYTDNNSLSPSTRYVYGVSAIEVGIDFGYTSSPSSNQVYVTTLP